MAARKFYSGDINIEHGGFFYELANYEHGYANAVRVNPCSDAGGPDNVFWVERVTVNVGDHSLLAFSGVGATADARRADRMIRLEVDDYGRAVAKAIERVERALACIGYDSPDMLADWDKRTVSERRHIIVYACLSYGYGYVEELETVQIGPGATGRKVDKVLRANASLYNYARGKL